MRAAAVFAGVFALANVAVGCRPAAPTLQDDAGPAIALTVAPPPPRALDASLTVTSPQTVPSSIPPRLGASGSTKNTIACGSKRCQGTDLCVLAGGAWQCAPSGSPSAEAASVRFACDDASDCDPGPDDPQPERMTCCTPHGQRSGATCNTRDGVDTDPCAMEICSLEQGAAACPKGRRCLDGYCRPAAPARATCVDGKQCPEATPVCRWQNGTGACVSRDEANALRAAIAKDPSETNLASVLACTRRSDCGVQWCCSDLGRGGDSVSWQEHPDQLPQITECRNACDDILDRGACVTDKDCSSRFQTGANGGSVAGHCERTAPTSFTPAQMGACR